MNAPSLVSADLGLSRPDPNIDHRRVPNLQTFFRRARAEPPPATRTPSAWRPGHVDAAGQRPAHGRHRRRRPPARRDGAQHRTRSRSRKTCSSATRYRHIATAWDRRRATPAMIGRAKRVTRLAPTLTLVVASFLLVTAVAVRHGDVPGPLGTPGRWVSPAWSPAAPQPSAAARRRLLWCAGRACRRRAGRVAVLGLCAALTLAMALVPTIALKQRAREGTCPLRSGLHRHPCT
jgi:hypothetical protein